MSNPIHDWVPGGGPETWSDTLAAHGDDLRDVIERDLIVTDPPAADWRPPESELC